MQNYQNLIIGNKKEIVPTLIDPIMVSEPHSIAYQDKSKTPS